MPEARADNITELLHRWSDGDKDAVEALLPQVYVELQLLARRYMNRERSGHTLETGALVHEAYVKLIDQSRVKWHSRNHFYAIAAQAMRRILVDHARSRNVDKRGGQVLKVALDEALHIGAQRPLDLVALDEALHKLAEVDPQTSTLVELRFFGGLTHKEIADVLDVSVSTVERQWRIARAWLYNALQQ